MNPHQDEQDEALRLLVAADAAAVDDFMTVSSFDGTTVMHDGFGAGEANQHDFAMPVLNRLVQGGMLRKTEFRSHGDFLFAVTDLGRERLARLASGGVTPVEAERARADRAEAAIAAMKDEAAANRCADIEKRQSRADRLGVVAGIAVVLVVGITLFVASEAPGFRVVVGIATLTGLAGVTFFSVVKRFVSRAAFRFLTFLHDHS